MDSYILDCLDRNMSLRDIKNKYNVSDVFAEYLKRKKMYSQDEINKTMSEVYYCYDA